MYSGKDPRRNSSGYIDPTAYKAMQNVERDEKLDARYRLVLSIIRNVLDLAGFCMVERFVIKDKKTGKVWR